MLGYAKKEAGDIHTLACIPGNLLATPPTVTSTGGFKVIMIIEEKNIIC